MLKRRLSRFALQATALLALAACGAQPYPEPSEAPPPPPPPAELLGAPEPQAALEPAPLAWPPEPPVAAAPPPPPPPVIIAMAPIPNPPEPSRPERVRPEQARPRAVLERAPTPTPRPAPYQSGVVAPRAVPARPPAPARAAPAPAPVAKAAPQPAAPKAALPQLAAPKAPTALAPPARVVPPAAPKVAQPAAPKLDPAPALKAAPGAAPADGTPLSDRAARLAALEGALTEAVAKSAKLTTPGRFVTGRAAEVTLTLPADFARTVREEAANNELADAAAAVNMTAVLSGDGFAVDPGPAQARPLVPGQPTEFRWNVTAEAGARGLRAEVGADLVGSGSEVLNFGAVEPYRGGFRLTPRVFGAAILVLIAALVIGWLARSRPTSTVIGRDPRRPRRYREPVNLTNEL